MHGHAEASERGVGTGQESLERGLETGKEESEKVLETGQEALERGLETGKEALERGLGKVSKKKSIKKWTGGSLFWGGGFAKQVGGPLFCITFF